MFDEILGPKKKKDFRGVSINLMGDMVPREKYEAAIGQLSKLTRFILDEFPSGTMKGRSVDTAIHLLKYYKEL